MGFIGDVLESPFKAVGGIFGGGGGGSAPAPQARSQPMGYPGYPQTYGPSAYPGWPVPAAPQQPTFKFEGDLSGPGAAETYFANNQGKFGEPTNTGQYWGQTQGKFGQPGQGDQFWNQAQGMFNTQKPGTNNAQTAFDQFQASAPANTDPFYQHAIDRTTAHLNNQAGARGQFNSTGALQTIGDAT